MYFVYILECSDQSLYTGITTDIKRRLSEHKNKIGGAYTASRTVRKIVFTEIHPNRSSASKREAYIKKLSRSQKLQLIENK